MSVSDINSCKHLPITQSKDSPWSKHARHVIVTETNRQLAHLKNTVGEKNRKLFFVLYHAGSVLGRRVQ